MNQPHRGAACIVGARITPPRETALLQAAAYKFASLGIRVLTGDAKKGGDLAARLGAGNMAMIFKPWDSTPASEQIAKDLWPLGPNHWNCMRRIIQRLHGRNPFQVLGPHLDTPVFWFLCWTPDGCLTHADRQRSTGGTGTSISIADVYGVPHIYNIQRPAHFAEVTNWVNN